MLGRAVVADEPMVSGGRDVPPVFVMGHHRSGTTILYDVLARTGLFNIVTLYHVLNRRRLRELTESGTQQQARGELTRLLESKGLTDRQFDSVKVTADLTEEYCYAFDNPGRHPKLSPSNYDEFLRFCRDVNFSQVPGRPLLLKNPFDISNFVFIRERAPDARMIFIHRTPAEVINSQISSIRSLLQEKNEYAALVVERYRRLWERPMKARAAAFIYSSRFPLLVEQVCRNVARANTYFVRNRHHVEENCCHITYGELCASPNQTVRRLATFLGAGQWTPAGDYADMVRPRPTRLFPEVSARIDRIRRDNAEYCGMFGF